MLSQVCDHPYKRRGFSNIIYDNLNRIACPYLQTFNRYSNVQVYNNRNFRLRYAKNMLQHLQCHPFLFTLRSIVGCYFRNCYPWGSDETRTQLAPDIVSQYRDKSTPGGGTGGTGAGVVYRRGGTRLSSVCRQMCSSVERSWILRPLYVSLP